MIVETDESKFEKRKYNKDHEVDDFRALRMVEHTE